MTAKLSDEQRRALQRSRGRLIPIEDEQTRKVYVLVERDELDRLFDNELRRKLQVGFDQVDRGQTTEWDGQRIKADARRELEQRSQTG